MQRFLSPVWAVLFAISLGLVACSEEETTSNDQLELARCLTENNWIMYGSITCSGCRAQRKAFGEAFEEIKEIECNPNVPGAQVDLCLAKKIGRTPTWIREVDGQERGRIEEYQLLENLAELSGCPFGPVQP